MNKNTFLNRNLLDWVVLLMGVSNLIIGLNKLSYISYINIFVGGYCVGMWAYAGFIHSYQKMVKGLLRLNSELLKTIERRTQTK